jgi:hypothetical protein
MKGVTMNRRVWVSVLLTVLVIGVVAAIGYGVYQIGFNQGVAATAGETTTVVREVGHHGYGWGFFPFGFIFPLFFFFLIFGLIGRAFWWGPWRGGWRGPYRGGPYGGGEGDVPPHIEKRLQTWHEEAHAEKKE